MGPNPSLLRGTSRAHYGTHCQPASWHGGIFGLASPTFWYELQASKLASQRSVDALKLADTPKEPLMRIRRRDLGNCRAHLS